MIRSSDIIIEPIIQQRQPEPVYCNCGAVFEGGLICHCGRSVSAGEPVGCPTITESRCERCGAHGALGTRCGITNSWRDVMRGVSDRVLCDGEVVSVPMYSGHGHPRCVLGDKP